MVFNFFGGFGGFLLLAAAVLLTIVSVSAPVWNTMAFIKINVPDHTDSTLSLGNWGYCILQASGDQCTSSHVKYQLGQIVSEYAGISLSSGTSSALHNLSGALILHPIAAAIAFLAFLTAAGAHRIGFIFASLMAMVAGVVTLVVFILDWIMFAIVHRDVNNARDGAASWSTAIWLVLAAFVCLLIGSFTVCCGCFADRRRRARAY